MRKPNNKTLLIVGAAAIAILGAGGAWMVTREPAKTEQAAEGEAGHEEGEAGHTEGEAGHAEGEKAEAPEGFVALDDARVQAAGIHLAPVYAGGGAETRLSGRVEPMVDARAAVAAVVSGRVERLLVVPGQSVRAGQPLAAIVSGEGASFRADIDSAAASADAARQAYNREQRLFDAGVVSRQQVEAARAQALSAEASARAARARSAAAGSPNASGRLTVNSPIAGNVTNVLVGPGGFVTAGGVVAEVTNPGRVEMVFHAPPQLSAGVRVGSRLRVGTPTGEIDAIVTGVSPDAGASDSGATIIRARAANGTLPPAGSPVTGSVTVGETAGGLTVPSEAVQTVEGRSVVFVKVKDGFQATPVLTGRQSSGRTEILNGLNGSEQVAARNAFLLKAELAKGEAEHGH